MPYKSEAQRKFFHAQLDKGDSKISKKVVDEFDKASKGLKLPKKVPAKPKITSIQQIREIGRRKTGR